MFMFLDSWTGIAYVAERQICMLNVYIYIYNNNIIYIYMCIYIYSLQDRRAFCPMALSPRIDKHGA